MEDKKFYELVIRHAQEWRTWFPEDSVQLLVKNAIDKTNASYDFNFDGLTTPSLD